MKHRTTKRLLLSALAGCSFVIGQVSPVVAQDLPDVGELYNKAVQFVDRDNDYAGGLKAANEIIDRFGEHAKEDFGAKFGSIYYLKGICLFNLKQYGDAYVEFERCHEEFPNTLRPDRNASTRVNVNNAHWRRAVFYMAACRQREEAWGEAIKIYDRFSSLKPEKGEYDPATLELNVATCYINAGNIKRGQALLESVIKRSDELRAKPTAVFTAFVALVNAWSEVPAESIAETTKTAHAFLDQHLDALRLSAYDMARYKFNWQIYQGSRGLGNTGMEGLGLRLLGLVPETIRVVKDLEVRKEAFTGTNDKIDAEIAAYEKEVADGNPIELFVLQEEARLLELRGDTWGSFAIYDHLATNFPKATTRPEILYNATRTAAVIRDMVTVQHHGLTLLAEYPNHKLTDAVSALLLEQLFFNGEYEKCLGIAADLRKGKSPGALERDLPDFAYGGSLFYLGRYGEAQPDVDLHVEKYEGSWFREHSLYHQAGNLVKLFQYPRAARLLDQFIDKYPESILMDLVLYDRATAHYGMDQLESCVNVIAKLKEKFPNSAVFDRALVLEGDVFQLKEEFDSARTAYAAARALAIEQRHDEIAANALFQMIAVEVAQEKWDPAIKFYDEFMATYPGSYFEPNVIVSAMPALEAKGRADVALGKLEEIIIVLGERRDVSQLERALASYARIFGEKNGPEALVSRLERFPNVPVRNNLLRAWLAVTRLNVLEDDANQKKFKNLAAEVKVAYADLKALPMDELSNYILTKIGQNLIKGGEPLEALPWLEAVRARPNPELREIATMGIAQVKANSASSAMNAEAIPLFHEIIEVHKTASLIPDAVLGLGRVLFKQEKWRNALDDALVQYIENKAWSQARAEVSWMAGRCYEELGKRDEAMHAYLNVYLGYTSQIQYSADAYYRAASLMQKNGKKDQAYSTLTDMLLRMGHLEAQDKTRSITKARELHLTLAKELGKNPEQDLTRVKE
ncbi:MAG: tetratricopeptide repeat protein [Verrucomicrobia bacterium]|nr:tetratricopeptide repeat protein [Verrucomicrobiota bacterium]